MSSQASATDLVQRSIDALRVLCIDTVEKAKSGHPGLPMGAAPMAYALWQHHLRHNPANPNWPDRDRFVLSAGHGSALVYALLHLTGYPLSLADLKRFRQLGSETPGHPECFLTPGVEATTGPLGQGAANAVGMAIAERALAHRFNRPGHELVNHHTYALVSDGDLMEGVAAEAGSLAGHLGLGKLIYVYDDNEVTLDGAASLSVSENTAERYRAYGWHIQRVHDGDHDPEPIRRAIAAAKAESERPSLILIRTTIGFGSPNKGGSSKCHGAPLGAEEAAQAKQALGMDPAASFELPADVLAHYRTALERGAACEAAWNERYSAYAAAFPELAREWTDTLAGKLPHGWDAELPSFDAGSSLATRVAGGQALNAVARRVPALIGGDADLSCSTMTTIADGGDFDGRTGAGRNLHFGVREHAMGAIANGIDYHGGLRPYTATFFVFSDYMRASVRIAALNGQPIIYVWTHDSIALGEDGPTHQPVEHLMSLRAMPNLAVVRPSDANEAVEAWRYAVQRTQGPTALVMTRQKLPTLDRAELGPATSLHFGAYILADAPGGKTPEALILATGSEVAVALVAREQLLADGVAARVVAMPCWELFEQQDRSYQDEVLPPSVSARVSVEAGVSFGWQRWLGARGVAVALDRFGCSAPGDINLREFGFSPENVAAKVQQVLREAP